MMIISYIRCLGKNGCMYYSSRDLVWGVNVKDRKIWKEFFVSFYEALCNHVYRIVEDKYITEDIVQDVFMKLWDGKFYFENEKTLSAYLYRAVTNNALKYLRDRHVESEKLKQWYDAEEKEMTMSDFSSVVREEVLRKLKQLIQLLPADRRKIVEMSMAGMHGEQIAACLGVTIYTVKQQKYRAYKFIREQLGEQWIVAFLFFL